VLKCCLLFVIVPVLRSITVLTGDRMLAAIDQVICPTRPRARIRRLARISKHAGRFIRGMGRSVLILGTYYAICLDVGGAANLSCGWLYRPVWSPFSLSRGCSGRRAGHRVLALVSMSGGVGSSIGMVAGYLLCWAKCRGHLLTPKLVGKLGRLHRVWLILALSVFGLAVTGLSACWPRSPSPPPLG